MLSAALIGVFLVIESRVASPLVPLSLFRNRNVSTSNVVGVLMAAGMFSYFFFSALYLQLVLEYSPLEVGLAYLPGTVIWGVSSLFLSQRLVMRYGIKPPLLAGLGLMTLALVLLARTPVDGNWAIDILPATIALGIGAGIAFNPILLAAMSGVGPEQAGLASGVVNTSFMMGGAVGLAILASLAASRSNNQLASGVDSLVALNSGYHLAFLVGAVFLLAAGSVGAALLRVEMPQAHGSEEALAEAASARAGEIRREPASDLAELVRVRALAELVRQVVHRGLRERPTERRRGAWMCAREEVRVADERRPAGARRDAGGDLRREEQCGRLARAVLARVARSAHGLQRHAGLPGPPGRTRVPRLLVVVVELQQHGHDARSCGRGVLPRDERLEPRPELLQRRRRRRVEVAAVHDVRRKLGSAPHDRPAGETHGNLAERSAAVDSRRSRSSQSRSAMSCVAASAKPSAFGVEAAANASIDRQSRARSALPVSASSTSTSSTEVLTRQPSCTLVPFSKSSGERLSERYVSNRPDASGDGVPQARCHARSSTPARSGSKSSLISAFGRSAKSIQAPVAATKSSPSRTSASCTARGRGASVVRDEPEAAAGDAARAKTEPGSPGSPSGTKPQLS